MITWAKFTKRLDDYAASITSDEETTSDEKQTLLMKAAGKLAGIAFTLKGEYDE